MSNISLLPATTPAELTAIPAPARGVFRRRIIVALAAAFSFAAPAGACELICFVTPYTLTGAADTPAAREAACNAARPGFRPSVQGMLESLPGALSSFAGAVGGIPEVGSNSTTSCVNIVANSAGASAASQIAIQCNYDDGFNCMSFTATYESNLINAYKTAYLSAYTGAAAATDSTNAANTYYIYYKNYFFAQSSCLGSPSCTSAAHAAGVAAVNAASCTTTSTSSSAAGSGKLVCCNM